MNNNQNQTRIYTSKEQDQFLMAMSGRSRCAYNWAIEKLSSTTGSQDQLLSIASLKESWLTEGPNWSKDFKDDIGIFESLKEALIDYTNYLEGKRDKPTFKRRKEGVYLKLATEESITSNQQLLTILKPVYKETLPPTLTLVRNFNFWTANA